MMMLLRLLQGTKCPAEADDALKDRVFSNVHAAIKSALEVSPLNARYGVMDNNNSYLKNLTILCTELMIELY